MSGLAERRLRFFGDAVRAERLRLGLAQKDLGYAAGMCQSEICRIESGRRSVGLRQLHRVADALGCPLDRLLAEARRAEEEAGVPSHAPGGVRPSTALSAPAIGNREAT